MRRFSITTGILAGVLTGITFIVITYLGARLAGLPFVPFDLFEFTTPTQTPAGGSG